uniref:Uncharacterized protein n=1 Tax=Ditylenchus dipsaci TaxID=166011 RepID=A0A915EEQ4_9BILA
MTRGVMKQAAQAKISRSRRYSESKLALIRKQLLRRHSFSSALYVDDADAKSYRIHFESKHPKSPLPAELVDIAT